MNNSIYITSIDVISTLNSTYEEFKNVLYSSEQNYLDLQKEQIDLSVIKKKYTKNVRRMNRASVLAFISSTQAFLQRELDKTNYNSYDIGTIYSVFSPSLDSSLSVLNTLYEKGIDLVSPIMFSSTVGNSCIAGVTIQYQLKGQSLMVKSSNALSYSSALLKLGKAEILLCGSYDVYIPEILEYYKNQPFVCSDVLDKVIPYETETKGIKLKECGVTLILERSESKYLDKSKILCEICSNSVVRKTADDKNAVQFFNKEDFEQAMQNALEEAGITVNKISAIISAAGSHPTLDKAEEAAILEVFEKKPYVISVKGIFGDSLGSNTLLNTAVAATVIKEKKLPKCYGVKKNNSSINIAMDEIVDDFNYVMANGYSEEGSIVSVILKSFKG